MRPMQPDYDHQEPNEGMVCSLRSPNRYASQLVDCEARLPPPALSYNLISQIVRRRSRFHSLPCRYSFEVGIESAHQTFAYASRARIRGSPASITGEFELSAYDT